VPILRLLFSIELSAQAAAGITLQTDAVPIPLKKVLLEIIMP
jgi:hypothetical protein